MTDVTAPELVRSLQALRSLTGRARHAGKVVGLVPTMGALHRGHLELVEVALSRADVVIVSIFVNPTQFGPNEDYERYPRDLEKDLAACADAGAHVVYAPTVETMYPDGHCTTVHVEGLTRGLCGRHRPGHFDGVATVVSKLFNQVGPCIAVFGRKDYQQLKVIERMTRDLAFYVSVVGVPTVREPDGLALSSRNAYLSQSERARALALVHGLSAAWRLVESSEHTVTAAEVRDVARAPLDRELDDVDYVDVCHPDTLQTLGDDVEITEPTLVAMAGRLGSTRLIDNLVLMEQSDPLSCHKPAS